MCIVRSILTNNIHIKNYIHKFKSMRETMSILGVAKHQILAFWDIGLAQKKKSLMSFGSLLVSMERYWWGLSMSKITCTTFTLWEKLQLNDCCTGWLGRDMYQSLLMFYIQVLVPSFYAKSGSAQIKEHIKLLSSGDHWDVRNTLQSGNCY